MRDTLIGQPCPSCIQGNKVASNDKLLEAMTGIPYLKELILDLIAEEGLTFSQRDFFTSAINKHYKLKQKDFSADLKEIINDSRQRQTEGPQRDNRGAESQPEKEL